LKKIYKYLRKKFGAAKKKTCAWANPYALQPSGGHETST